MWSCQNPQLCHGTELCTSMDSIYLFPGYDKYNQYDALGAYEVVILARSSSDFDSIKAQVDEFTRKFNAISHDGYKLLWHGQPYAYWKTLFRVDSMTDLDL